MVDQYDHWLFDILDTHWGVFCCPCLVLPHIMTIHFVIFVLEPICWYCIHVHGPHSFHLGQVSLPLNSLGFMVDQCDHWLFDILDTHRGLFCCPCLVWPHITTIRVVLFVLETIPWYCIHVHGPHPFHLGQASLPLNYRRWFGLVRECRTQTI